MSIPEFMFDLYKTDANCMMTDLGIDCKLIYPAVKGEQCNNCITMVSGGSTQNHYRNGGPRPFHMSNCPLCGGAGFKSSESPVEELKLRINYNPKTWLKVNVPIEIPDGSIQVIGDLGDMPKIKKAEEIIINQDTVGMQEEKYALGGEPVPHGLKDRTFFVVILDRV